MSNEHWTRPPPADERLYAFFTADGLAVSSIHGAFEHMSATSFARGVPDPDRRMVNTGVTGFRQRSESELLDRMPTTMANEDAPMRAERVSKTQRYRETAAILAQMAPEQVKVLRLAFGPQDAIPALKLGANPQARARLDGDDQKAARNERDKHQKRLGSWRQLLPDTKAAQEGYATSGSDKPFLSWLVNAASDRVLTAARVEAHGMVHRAWNEWADRRGRRAKRTPESFVFDRSKYE